MTELSIGTDHLGSPLEEDILSSMRRGEERTLQSYCDGNIGRN